MSFGMVFLRHYQYPAHIAKMSIPNINNIYYLRCGMDRGGALLTDGEKVW